MMKKKDMFRMHNFKIFLCNPNDPNFDLFKFLGEINLYISELHERNFVNGIISKITEDFEKINKIKRNKAICQKHFTKL